MVKLNNRNAVFMDPMIILQQKMSRSQRYNTCCCKCDVIEEEKVLFSPRCSNANKVALKLLNFSCLTALEAIFQTGYRTKLKKNEKLVSNHPNRL